MLNVLIPMAGKGSRFADAGYQTPKPLIDVAGKTLAERSISTLNLPDARYIFITRSFDDPEDNERLTQIFSKTCKNFIEVRVDSKHLGAAHSALYAEKYIDPEDELIITNCDQSLIWDVDKFLEESRKPEIDIAVVLFQSTDPCHSYLKIDNGRISEIVEKNPVSDHALIGVHYWKKAFDFFDSARKLVKEYKSLGYKEPYISTSINYLINDNKRLFSYFLSEHERYYSLGTPKDMKLYLNITDDYFVNLEDIKHTAKYGEITQHADKLKYNIINNVEIQGPGGHELLEIDKAFLFHGQEKSFYHTMTDVFGQYLALKNIAGDDLVPLFIETSPDCSLSEASPFINELINLKIIDLKVADESVNKIKINKLYVISPRGFQLFYKLFWNSIPEILIEESHYGNTAYVASFLKPMSDLIIQKLGEVSKTDRKIFLHSSNKWVAVDESIAKQHKRFGSQQKYEDLVKEYEELGYEIIDPELLSFMQQAALVRSSSSIATAKGSNSIHSIYAHPDTEFIMINLSKDNTFPHEVVVNYFINNPTFIDRTENNENP